jgi:hypothetical protein
MGCGSPFQIRYVFASFAVPQTSWNLLHYAPDAGLGQMFSVCNIPFSSVFIWFVFSRLAGCLSA